MQNKFGTAELEMLALRFVVVVLDELQFLLLLLLTFYHPFDVVHHGREAGDVPLVLPHVHRFLPVKIFYS